MDVLFLIMEDTWIAKIPIRGTFNGQRELAGEIRGYMVGVESAIRVK